MPLYEYRCDTCGHTFEALQRLAEPPLADCPRCGGPLRKVLHPVAIHFKGSGFYTTDYGKGSGRRAGGKDAGSRPRRRKNSAKRARAETSRWSIARSRSASCQEARSAA